MWDPVSKKQSRPMQALAGWLFAIPTLITVIAVTAVIGTDVVSRYVFNSPLLWSIEANELLLLVMVFCAMPYVWERGAHVHMELLQPYFPPWLKAFAGLLSAAAGLAYAGLLTYEMCRQFFKMRQYGEGAETLGIPFWPFALLVSFVAAVMCLQFLIHAWSSIRDLVGRRPPEGK